MGRLLKKKTSAPKKNKGSDPGAAVVEGDSAAAGTQADTGGDEAAKKAAAPVRKYTPPKPAPVKQKPNWMTNSIQFLREVKVELKKVTWPSRKQTIGSTLVVLVMVMIISLFLGVVDIGLSSLVRVVLQ